MLGVTAKRAIVMKILKRGKSNFFVTFSYNIIANFSIISISGPKEELVSKATS